MPVKILGQTISVAPSTSATTTNLVGDSSFASSISAGSLNTRAVSSTITSSFNGSTRWHYTSGNTTEMYLVNSTNRSVTAPFGDSGSAIGGFFNGGGSFTINIGYGYTTSSNPIYNTSTSNAFSTGTAISVSGGTTYYFGSSYYVNDIGSTFPQVIINWWDASGTYISNWSFQLARSSASWQRTTANSAAPSNAAFATFYFQFDYSTSNRWQLVDGVTFATTTTQVTTFTEPKLPSIAATTSPFDKKTDGYATETATAITTVSFAGPIQTLYTCPAGSSAVVSTITATNLNTSSTNFRLIVQKNGESLATKHFIVLDQPIGGSTTEAFTIGITLAAGDILKVAADTALVSFSAFGSEN